MMTNKTIVDTNKHPAGSIDKIDPAKTHKVAEFKYERPLTTLRVDPTSQFIAAGAEDLDIQLWNLNDGQRQTLKGHQSWVRSLDFPADGKQLITACWGGVIKIWDLTQATPTTNSSSNQAQGMVLGTTSIGFQFELPDL